MIKLVKIDIDLNSGLGEVDAHGDLLARVNVRVVRLLEGPFQFLDRKVQSTLNYQIMSSGDGGVSVLTTRRDGPVGRISAVLVQ